MANNALMLHKTVLIAAFAQYVFCTSALFFFLGCRLTSMFLVMTAITVHFIFCVDFRAAAV